MARWLAARARNALRRPLRIMGVTVTAFIATLVALVLIPRHAVRTAHLLLQGTDNRPDTTAIANRVAQARVSADLADSALERARAHAYARSIHPLPTDTALRGPMSHRDSVALEVAELAQLLSHAEDAPLSSSYRALAHARTMRDDPQVQALVDSLGEIERARGTVNATGGVDPAYVALTARVNAIGQALEHIAESKRAMLLVSSAVVDSAVPSVPYPDTLHPEARADLAHRVLAAVTDTLDSLRAVNVALEARAERAREIANVSAPPLALLGAALVLGVAIGFLATLAVELITPRVADEAEAARIAKARMLGVIKPPPRRPDRTRRVTDAPTSPLLDLNSEAYRFVYLQLANTRRSGKEPLLVLFTGEDADIAAAVATNVAVAAAYDSRSVVLVDVDRRVGTVAHLLGVRRAPGVADALAGHVPWPATIVTTTVGRDRAIDVIPPGNTVARASDPAMQEEIRQDALRLARRYDVVLMSVSEGSDELESPAAVPGFAATVVSHEGAPDVVVCVRVARTPLTRLQQSADVLRDRGFHVRGVVLWDLEIPDALRATGVV